MIMSHCFYDLIHLRGQDRNREMFSFVFWFILKTSKFAFEINGSLVGHLVLIPQKLAQNRSILKQTFD